MNEWDEEEKPRSLFGQTVDAFALLGVILAFSIWAYVGYHLVKFVWKVIDVLIPIGKF